MPPIKTSYRNTCCQDFYTAIGETGLMKQTYSMRGNLKLIICKYMWQEMLDIVSLTVLIFQGSAKARPTQTCPCHETTFLDGWNFCTLHRKFSTFSCVEKSLQSWKKYVTFALLTMCMRHFFNIPSLPSSPSFFLVASIGIGYYITLQLSLPQ